MPRICILQLLWVLQEMCCRDKNMQNPHWEQSWTWNVGAMCCSCIHVCVPIHYRCVIVHILNAKVSKVLCSAFKFGNKLDSLPVCFFGHVENEPPQKPKPSTPPHACSAALPAEWKQRALFDVDVKARGLYLRLLITDIQSLLVIILDNLPAAKPHLLCI